MLRSLCSAWYVWQVVHTLPSSKMDYEYFLYLYCMCKHSLVSCCASVLPTVVFVWYNSTEFQVGGLEEVLFWTTFNIKPSRTIFDMSLLLLSYSVPASFYNAFTPVMRNSNAYAILRNKYLKSYFLLHSSIKSSQ